MRLRPFLMPMLMLAVGSGLTAWLVFTDPPPPPERTKPLGVSRERLAKQAKAALRSQILGEKGETPEPPAPMPNDIRDVSPEGVTPPQVTDALTRIEPSKPYIEIRNPPPETLPEGKFELRRPQVLDGGTLKHGNLLIRLAYIKPLALDQTCVSRLGGSWPCGARARTSLRGLVRMFTITCEKVATVGPQQISATCTRKRLNLGEWLVRYGWADPTDDAPETYTKLSATARGKKRGKWQSEWLKELPQITGPAQSDQPLLPADDMPTISEDDILVSPPELVTPDVELRSNLIPPNG